MGRSPGSRKGRIPRLLFLAGLSASLLASAPGASAANTPNPVPGPPVLPVAPPAGTPWGVLLAGLLIGATVVATAALASVWASRRRRAPTVARAVLSQPISERAADAGGHYATAARSMGQDDDQELKLAS